MIGMRLGPVSFTPELVIALQKVFVYATKLPILVCTHSSQMMLPFLPKALALTDLRVLVKDACDIGHHFIANWHLFRILFAATTFYPVDLFWDGHAQPKIGSSANFYWHFATLFYIYLSLEPNISDCCLLKKSKFFMKFIWLSMSATYDWVLVNT